VAGGADEGDVFAVGFDHDLEWLDGDHQSSGGQVSHTMNAKISPIDRIVENALSISRADCRAS
jgi:hypothetical protein